MGDFRLDIYLFIYILCLNIVSIFKSRILCSFLFLDGASLMHFNFNIELCLWWDSCFEYLSRFQFLSFVCHQKTLLINFPFFGVSFLLCMCWIEFWVFDGDCDSGYWKRLDFYVFLTAVLFLKITSSVFYAGITVLLLVSFSIFNLFCNVFGSATFCLLFLGKLFSSQ